MKPLTLVTLISMPLVAIAAASGCGSDVTHARSKATVSAQTDHFLNDGDREREGDADGDNNADRDKDAWLDYLPRDYKIGENSRYHDADDHALPTYGSAPTPSQEQSVVAAVGKYYALAASEDGPDACSQLVPSLAKAIPSDYGQSGPSYLRAGRTCAEILTLLFKHYHRQLVAGVTVTGVRITGGQAIALLGSTAMPPGFILVKPVDHTWRIAQLLGNENQLP